MADHREIEDTYDVTEGTVLPRLDGLPGVASVETESVELEATYFDTAGLALARAGATVRRRTGGDDQGWHLKLPDPPEGRYEVHEAWGRATRTVPKRLREVVAGLTGGETMRPIATLRTHRTEHRLLDDEATVLGVVCDDRVVAEVAALGDLGAATHAWREWEVELVAGDATLLVAAAPLLEGAGATGATVAAKLARALGSAAPAAPAPEAVSGRKSPTADLVQFRLAELVAQMRLRDPLVRADAPESVHDLRVAVRRLRGALASYRPALDRAETDPLRAELQWLAGVLGAPRDAEVLRDRLVEMLDAEDPSLVSGAARTRVTRDLAGRYDEAHQALLAAMRSERYVALMAALRELAESPPWAGSAEKPVKKVLPSRVRQEWKRVRRRVEAMDAAPDAAEREARMHDVRKAAKRARYATEPLGEVYGPPALALVDALKGLQTVIGDHHDLVIAQQELRRLAADASAAGEDTFTYGVLYARAETRARETDDAFSQAWEKASSKDLRRWLE